MMTGRFHADRARAAGLDLPRDRQGPRRALVRVASTLLLLNEAFLGALLVKLGYVTGNQSAGRMVVLSIHLSNTLLLVAALTLTARFLSSGQRWAGLHRAPGFGWAIAGLAATIGVGVSGSMAALGDTLFPATSLQAAYRAGLRRQLALAAAPAAGASGQRPARRCCS